VDIYLLKEKENADALVEGFERIGSGEGFTRW
jgi:hypothetical protein